MKENTCMSLTPDHLVPMVSARTQWAPDSSCHWIMAECLPLQCHLFLWHSLQLEYDFVCCSCVLQSLLKVTGSGEWDMETAQPPNGGHHGLWFWTQFNFVLEEHQTQVACIFFTACQGKKPPLFFSSYGQPLGLCKVARAVLHGGLQRPEVSALCLQENGRDYM